MHLLGLCVCVCVRVHIYPTVSDKCPAGQHSSQHELGHSQHGAREAAHYGHAEEEAVLNKDQIQEAGLSVSPARG